jgi:hypothetical protein
MIKTALIAAIALVTASAAFATEFDGNLANRYAGFSGASVQSLQTRNVALTGQVAAKKIDREGASHDGQ